MLKGFVSGEEKDIKRIAMGTRNLFDKSTITTGHYASTSGTTANNSYYCSDFIPITAATYYFQNVVGKGYQNSVVVYDANKQGLRYANLSGSAKTSGAITFQSGDAYIRINCYYQTDVDTVMINEGSTALPYEPYGYQEGWEVRDSQDRLIWGREDELQTATGTLPFKGYSLPVKVKSLLGNAVQNGTPSPGPANPNLADPSKTVPGYQESNGSIHVPSAAEEITTDFIPFTTTLYILISGSANGDMNYAAYNANKQIIGIYNTGFTPNTVITANPQTYTGAAYLRASWTHGVDQPICITTKQTSTFIPFDPNPPGPVIPEMCGVRTGNLLDADTAYGTYKQSDGTYKATIGTFYTTHIKPFTSDDIGKTYTFYVYIASMDSSIRNVRVSANVNGSEITGNYLSAPGATKVSFTVETINDYLYFGYGQGVNDMTVKDIMLVSGSTAPTSYIPYGWQIPFENHGENLFDAAAAYGVMYSNGTISGELSALAGVKNTFPSELFGQQITISVKANSIQSNRAYIRCNIGGTNIDSNAVTQGNTGAMTVTVTPTSLSDKWWFTYGSGTGNNTFSDLMLNLGSTAKPYSPYLNETIPVYLGEVPTVRRVRKLMLTGSETWYSVQQAGVFYTTAISTLCNISFTYNVGCISDSYVLKKQSTIANLNSGEFTTDTNGFLWFKNGDYSTLTEWKQYLSQQYTEGHPVTVWYLLNVETMGIVNEPLMKIGRFADELTTIQVHGLSAPLYGIGDYKDTLNLSTGVVTRKVKRLVLDGTESNWSATYWVGSYVIYMNAGITRPTPISNTGVCTHFVQQNGQSIQSGCFNIQYTEYNNRIVIGFGKSGFTTLDDFKSYLAAQYRNGTPVTIWYVLDTPETETVTVPTGMTGEIEGYLTQVSTPTPTNRSVPKWNGVEETGGTYAVTVYTPPDIPTTTGQNTLTVDTDLAPSKLEISVHAKKIHYGFKIDKSNDDSDSAVIYTHDAVTMTPAHMDFTNDRFDYGSWGNAFFVRDCYPVALNLDGTIAYRLDPDDYTKKMDGTPSDIFYELLSAAPSDWNTQWKQYYTKSGDEYILNDQGSAPTFATDTYYKLTYNTSFTGNFMMAFPKVWFYRHEDSQYNYIEISDHKLSNDWKCYAHINASGQEVDFIYLPLFKGVIVNSKLRSLPGQIPQGNTTATDEVNAATALGSRWQIWDHSSVELINDLLVLMTKSIDSQGRFGQGRSTGHDPSDTVTYGKLQTGTLIKKGKFHGYSVTTKEVKVFGLEGFWANSWERLQGLLLDNNVWKVKMTPPYDFTGTNFVTLSNAEVPTENGYLSRIQTSEYGSIPASVANGSSTKYFKDPFIKSATGTCVALRGGRCDDDDNCGFRYVYVGGAASDSRWGIGASPVYK